MQRISTGILNIYIAVQELCIFVDDAFKHAKICRIVGDSRIFVNILTNMKKRRVNEIGGRVGSKLKIRVLGKMMKYKLSVRN